MLCRLCTVEVKSFQKLEGAICDILTAVLRKKCIQTNNEVICYNCVKKLEKSFEFKTTCLRTQKLLSLYGGSNNKIFYIKDNKLCVTSKDDNLKLCRTCLRLIENCFANNYEVLEKLALYIPELVISDKDSSLFCYNCSDHFRIYIELINIVNRTENIIVNYCNDKNIINIQHINLDDIMLKEKEDESPVEENIIKLLRGNANLFDLENEFESTYLDDIEDPKKRIIKKIMEEDVDLFYKEKPNFDVSETFPEENPIDRDYTNIFSDNQLLLSHSEDVPEYKHTLDNVKEESSMRLSFETEESSLSPGNLSDRQYYDYESTDEGRKDDTVLNNSNTFIFFDNYGNKEERCSCENDGIKRKWCEKCKLKKNVEEEDESPDVATKKPKKEGKKKCRKMYGIQFKDLWCTRCKWKKACSRFGNTKAVSRR